MIYKQQSFTELLGWLKRVRLGISTSRSQQSEHSAQKLVEIHATASVRVHDLLLYGLNGRLCYHPSPTVTR